MHTSFTSMRPLMSNAALATGVALTLGTPAFGQSSIGGPSETIVLDTVTLEGASGGPVRNTNRATTGISRLPATVQDTPRVVNVVSEQLLEDQKVTSVEQALRNVPGITLGSGEGNGGQNGDQFRIRGFNSKGDVYTDGLRDFGVYVRDSFNLGGIEVFKGPAGDNFGAGTSGGLINQTSKTAHTGNEYKVDGTVGSGPLYRSTFDLNQQLDETTAIRINGMVHEQDVADRDNVFSDRKGLAAAVAFGLGTPTTLNLSHFYQHTDRIPDYGVPFITGADGFLRPLTEYGVRRDLSYVRDTDMDVANVHATTARFASEVNDWLTVNSDTRLTFYDRDVSATVPRCLVRCSASFLGGENPLIDYDGSGGGQSYFQDGWGLQNITSAKTTFETGFLRHELTVGTDLYYTEDDRNAGVATGRVLQRLLTPLYDSVAATVTENPNQWRAGTASDVALFVSDRVHLNDEFSLLASLRWDNYESSFASATIRNGATAEQKSDEISPSFSVFYEPTEFQTYYASFARSYTPVGNNVSGQQTNGTAETPQAGIALEPERSDLYEVGAKIGILDGALSVNGALFRVDKTNSFAVNPVTGDVILGFNDAGQGRRVQGVEAGISGDPLEGWNVQLAYAYLDGEVRHASDARLIGNDMPDVAEHNVSLFTTYDITPHLGQLPGQLKLGGGVVYASEYFSDAANLSIVPETFALDGLISYEYKNVTASLNGYNLTDELNYSAAFNNGRATPAPGRTVLLTVGAKF